jgi:hypothetical protein
MWRPPAEIDAETLDDVHVIGVYSDNWRDQVNGEAPLIVVHCTRETAESLEDAFGESEPSVRTRFRWTVRRHLCNVPAPQRIAAVDACAKYAACVRAVRAGGGASIARDVNEAMDVSEAAKAAGVPALLLGYHMTLARLAELSDIQIVEALPRRANDDADPFGEKAPGPILTGLRQLPGEPDQYIDDADVTTYGNPHGDVDVAEVAAEPFVPESVPDDVLDHDAAESVPPSLSGYYLKATVERWTGSFGEEPKPVEATLWMAHTTRACVAMRLSRLMAMTHPPSVQMDLPQFEVVVGDSLSADERFIIAEERENGTSDQDDAALVRLAEERQAKLEREALAAELDDAARATEQTERESAAATHAEMRRLDAEIAADPVMYARAIEARLRPMFADERAAATAIRLANVDAASDALAALREVWWAYNEERANFAGVVGLHREYSDVAARVIDAYGRQGYFDTSADPLRNVRCVAGAVGVHRDANVRHDAIEAAFGELADLRRDIALDSRRTRFADAQPKLPGVAPYGEVAMAVDSWNAAQREEARRRLATHDEALQANGAGPRASCSTNLIPPGTPPDPFERDAPAVSSPFVTPLTTNQKIVLAIEELNHDATQTAKAIAKKVGVSPSVLSESPLWQQAKQMITRGAIRGFRRDDGAVEAIDDRS